MKALAGWWTRLWVWTRQCLVHAGGRRVVALLLFAGALAFMILAVIRDWEALVAFPWQFRIKYIAALVVMHSLASGSLFLAWHLMMRRLAAQSDWRSDFSIYNLSILARRIPTPLWYVGGRVYLYRQRQVPGAVILSASGLEAALIALAGIVCYVLLLPWYSYTQPWPWPILLGLWLALMIVLVLRPNLLIDLVNRVLRLLGRQSLDVAVARSSLLLWGVLYLATWFLDGIGLFFAVSALLPDPPPLADIVGVSTTYALVGLTALVLPGGFGLKEVTMSLLLSLWIPLPAGVAISIFYRLAQTLIEAFWALVGRWIGQRAGQGPELEPDRTVDSP